MPLPTTPLCSDEDVALRAGDDFARIAPLDITIAAGNDGAFLNTDRWTLGAASVDFVAQGVVPGMVAVLAIPKRTGIARDTQTLAVQAVGSAGMTLRRKGMAAATGQPPGPAAGSTAVQFTVATLAPQIALASSEVYHRFGADERNVGRRYEDLYDPDELRLPTVLTVLWKLYQTAAQTGSDDAKEGVSAMLWAKAKQARSELDDVLDRLVVRWQTIATLGQISPPTTRTMRLSR